MVGAAECKRLKLIALGFNIHSTGLTRVMHAIVRRLAARHEIHYLGIGYSGETVREPGLTIYPTNPRGGDGFAAFQTARLIEEIQPDLVFILHDIWMFEYYFRILGPYRGRTRFVAYIPLDGNILRAQDAAPLRAADRVVVYTEFARTQFRKAFGKLRDEDNGQTFPPVEVIPHGVNVQDFFPFPALVAAGFDSSARAPAKREVFGALAEIENSFVVLNASRPDRRKRVDLTLEGFALFAAGKPPGVKLCLHHAIFGDTDRRQTRAWVERWNLEDRVVVNPLGGGPCDDRNLNLLYNACDVGINTSMGEGWGLVSFEHGAAGAAQIVPDHSACSDLWRGRAELVPPAKTYVPEFSVLELGEVSPQGVAEALEKLYRDPAHRRKLAEKAWQAALNPAYSWDAIANEFEQLLLDVAGHGL